jgi:hypothetical protein
VRFAKVVAEALAPYRAATCGHFDFVPEANGLEAAIDGRG